MMVTIIRQKDMGYALGSAEYLTKPIDRARLNGYVEKVVRKGPYSTESLMNQLRRLGTAFARPERA